MGLWPPMLFGLLATLFLVRAQQQAGRLLVNLGACLLAVLAGLTWHERGILTIAVLAGVAVARSERTGWRRIPDALVRRWQLWVPLAVLTVGYLVLHRALTSVAPQQASVESRLEIVRAFVLRNTLPGLASGPWQSHTLGGAIVPAPWAEVVAVVLTLSVGVLVVRRGGPARWVAPLLLAAYVGGDVLLLLLGRSGFGEIIGLDPRYTADVVGAAVLFAAIALEGGPTIVTRPRYLARRTPALAIVASLVYLAGSALTTAQLAPDFENHDDRRFFDHLRAGLARDDEQVLVDRLAPPDILLPLVGKDALLSSVLEPLPEHPAFDAPSTKLRRVTDDGRLQAVAVVPVSVSRPGSDGGCGHAVRGRTTIPLTLPMFGHNLVRLEVFTDRAADDQVRIGRWTGTVHVVRGPQVIWLVVPDDAGDYTSVDLTGTGSGTLCVVSVVVGPAETGAKKRSR